MADHDTAYQEKNVKPPSQKVWLW